MEEELETSKLISEHEGEGEDDDDENSSVMSEADMPISPFDQK